MRTYQLTCLLALLVVSGARAAAPVATEPLRGKVYAADGSPAPGAIVWTAKFTYGPLERRETTTDGNGGYEFRLEPGAWYVWARRGTQGGEGPAVHESVEIVAGQEPMPVAIQLEERGKFRGRLLQAETDKPLAGAQFFIDAGIVVRTGADGRFELGGLRRANHEAFVVAPGRMRMRVLFDTTAKPDTQLDVLVPRAGKIVGRVTDLDGKPIAGAHVGRQTSGSFFSINALYVACDATGRFEYDDAVTPDQPTRLKASAPGYVDEERDGLSPSPGGKPLELNFRLSPKPGERPNPRAPSEDRQRVVAGTVLGPNGKPVAGVLVRWGYEPKFDAIQTRTDKKGRFRLTVPDKTETLAVLPRDFTPEFLQVVAAGDQTVEVTLQAGHTARGRISDDTGKPIKDVRVFAMVPSPNPRIGNPYWLMEAGVRSDAQGKFELKGISDRATFDFLKPGMTQVRNLNLALDGADNAVTMLYGGAISGRVMDRDGKPIRNFRVLVGFPRERKAGDQTDGFFAGYSGIGVRFTSADGSFVLTGVGAGSVYRITALADGHGEAVGDRVVAVALNRLGTAAPKTLRAGPPVTLRVRAVTTGGKPIAKARVTLVNGEPGLDRSFAWGYHDTSWENMVRGRTNADGLANFPSLSFSGATVLVQAPGYARVRGGWRNAEKDLTVELVPEAVIAGEVRNAAGEPLKSFRVSLTADGDQIAASVHADDKGRFRISELPAGAWSLVLRSSDGRTEIHQDQATLKAGETKELRIEVKKE